MNPKEWVADVEANMPLDDAKKSEPDLFDRVARKAFHAERKCVSPEIAEPMAYADAFRAEFASRTCASCRHRILRPGAPYFEDKCGHGIECDGGIDRTTFSCSLFERAAAEGKP